MAEVEHTVQTKTIHGGLTAYFCRAYAKEVGNLR